MVSGFESKGERETERRGRGGGERKLGILSLSSVIFLIFWEEFRVWLNQIDETKMNMMRRLKSIASGRTSVSSEPVSVIYIYICSFIVGLER